MTKVMIMAMVMHKIQMMRVLCFLFVYLVDFLILRNQSNLNHLSNAGTEGRLIFRGNDSSNTVIISDNFHNTLAGRNVSRITISHLHFARDKVLYRLLNKKQRC